MKQHFKTVIGRVGLDAFEKLEDSVRCTLLRAHVDVRRLQVRNTRIPHIDRHARDQPDDGTMPFRHEAMPIDDETRHVALGMSLIKARCPTGARFLRRLPCTVDEPGNIAHRRSRDANFHFHLLKQRGR